MQNITFNGKTSFDFGIRVTCTNPYVAPMRRQIEYTVPGRNGTVIVDDGSFENVQMIYEIASYTNPKDAIEVTNAVKSWLLSAGGYIRLEDSNDPDCYRMARCTSAEFEKIGSTGKKVKGTITFDCQPERWLKNGEMPIALQTNIHPNPFATTICNITENVASPILTVGASSGDIKIWVRQSDWFGYAMYTVHAHDGSIVIDTATRNSVFSTTGFSANAYVTFEQNGSDDFELRPGESILYATFADASDSGVPVSIKPRWWMI